MTPFVQPEESSGEVLALEALENIEGGAVDHLLIVSAITLRTALAG